MFETLQPSAYGVSFAFFALSLTTTILRLYSRKWIIKSFGIDDWWMLVVFVRSAVIPLREYTSNVTPDIQHSPTGLILRLSLLWRGIVRDKPFIITLST